MKSSTALSGLGLAAFLLGACTTTQGPTVPPKVVAGTVNVEAVYAENCAKCHGHDGKANTFRGMLSRAQDLSKSKWQKSVSDADIIEAIKDGPGLMPAFGDKLRGSEMNALVGYVRRLGR